MTRAPIEDCLDLIPNRFELCAVASKRARQLARGATSSLPYQGHKSTVQALMEIADGNVGRGVLDEPDLPIAEAAARVFDELDPSFLA